MGNCEVEILKSVGLDGLGQGHSPVVPTVLRVDTACHITTILRIAHSKMHSSTGAFFWDQRILTLTLVADDEMSP